jgi:hypothetical protein
MSAIRDGGKVQARERIAVLARSTSRTALTETAAAHGRTVDVDRRRHAVDAHRAIESALATMVNCSDRRHEA